ncbi:MAG: hypothetical protein Q7V20_03730 [Aquabacterium sp.]|uniref:hypothetical protein n=1 Tax=Aquabacterium sp. TaxID=1872578 RepID=UPI00272287F9|nr:hypothetical protein [Aquabacterium sp.]MDO9002552.1 hypothetical protein [Aquabacterium sp.]
MSSRPTDAGSATSPVAATPWWREPFMWMVVGGPLTVVVAGFATLAIAIAYPDPVIVAPSTGNVADQPAVQARNHAASPKP